jgi:hypothetical protein
VGFLKNCTWGILSVISPIRALELWVFHFAGAK